MKESLILIMKKSGRKKLLLLDGYDEFSGEYFRIHTKLSLHEWENTIVIITSRREKLTDSEFCTYFSLDDD